VQQARKALPHKARDREVSGESGWYREMFPFRPFKYGSLRLPAEDERGFFMDTDIAMKRRA